MVMPLVSSKGGPEAIRVGVPPVTGRLKTALAVKSVIKSVVASGDKTIP
jgi:hypothetical protein